MAEVELTGGGVALVDDQDLPLVSGYRWRRERKRNVDYAIGWVNGRYVPMHRLIAGTPKGLHTDHRNGDGLDNRRANLRTCTIRENSRKQAVRLGRGTSQFKGVFLCRDRKRQCWGATIKVDRRSINLGTFDDEVLAARAYNAAARDHFGEFAEVNPV